jgi:hypothetical protein
MLRAPAQIRGSAVPVRRVRPNRCAAQAAKTPARRWKQIAAPYEILELRGTPDGVRDGDHGLVDDLERRNLSFGKWMLSSQRQGNNPKLASK